MFRKIFLLTLLVCLLLPVATYAAAAPATGTNWLQQVTTEVDTLTTTHGDALVDMGVTELNFIAPDEPNCDGRPVEPGPYGYRLQAG